MRQGHLHRSFLCLPSRKTRAATAVKYSRTSTRHESDTRSVSEKHAQQRCCCCAAAVCVSQHRYCCYVCCCCVLLDCGSCVLGDSAAWTISCVLPDEVCLLRGVQNHFGQHFGRNVLRVGQIPNSIDQSNPRLTDSIE